MKTNTILYRRPHPIEAIKFRIEQGDIDEKELTKLLGGRIRKSGILSGKRKLSLNMIRALNKKLKSLPNLLLMILN